MSNVVTINEKVNGSAARPTVAEVVAWTEVQINKGDMGADGGRLRITSLNAMVEMVAADEPNDAISVMENMDRLRERWARKHPDMKADTAQTYASRAKTTIQAYQVWAAAPDKYDPKKVLLKQKDSTSAKPAQKKSSTTKVKVEAAPIVPPPAPPPVAPRAQQRTFPLGADREPFVFELPSEGITFADVRKIAVHLFTLASDFDISDSAQAQVFGIVVRGPKD